MARTAILMPYPELRELAESLVPEYPRISPMCIEYVHASKARRLARALEEKGCELIIARGLHAKIARESVVIPVVEMRASTQELACLVADLRRRLLEEGAPEPIRLGIIGFFNMFHSTDRLGELLGLDLRTYTVTDIDQYESITDKAAGDGCQGVVGGEIVGRRARELGMAFSFLSMGEESMREVLEAASRVSYASDLIKRSNAEMETMLSYTFSGIMQADKNGVVRRANRACYQLLEKEPDGVIGLPVTRVLPDVSAWQMGRVLTEGREIEAQVIRLGQQAVLMNIVPIRVEESIEGAIFTLQESRRIVDMDSRLRQESGREGYRARFTFDDVRTEDEAYLSLLGRLRRISRYAEPVLLRGESGTGKGVLAQCIHSESLYGRGAFVPVDCSVFHPEDLDSLLFGNVSARRDGKRTLAEEARGGTLYLRRAEALPRETQYKLLRLIRGQFLHNGPNAPEALDVRVVASAEADLRELADAGAFRRDLYYELSALELEVPPLRARPRDILPLFSRLLKQRQEKVGRHIRLTQGALGLLRTHAWPGNLDEMNSLCERLVLLEEKKSIDEETLRRHLRAPAHAEAAPPAGTDPEAEALAAALRRNLGSREKTARELGVSKTTLWRRMKAHGLS